MKKLISLFLAFAMVFSLAMPAFAAEDTRTIYFENTGNWSEVYAYAWDDSYTEYLASWPGSAMTKVEGETNIYSIEVSTAATKVIFNDNNNGVQSAELTIPTDGNDLYSCGSGTWSTYGSAGDTSDQTKGDVTASYTPVITISGVTISENTSSPDAVAVDETNKTYTVTIPADQTEVTVDINVSGQNLDKIPLDSNNYRVMLDPQELNAFAITNGNPDTGNAVLPISINEDYIGTSDLQYSNDGGTTWTDTGWNVVVQQAEPTTAEAKWGASKDSLTGSGTLAEAITAATASGSTVQYIQLQSDVTAESSFVITSGEFTIDLNGHTVTYNDGYTFSLQKSGTKVTFADSGTTGTVTSGAASAAAIDLYNGAEVLITGGSYSGNYALSIDSSCSAAITGGTFTGAEGFAINNSGTLTISGGTIHSSSLANVAVSGTTTITGGTFDGSGTRGNFAYWSGTLDLSGYNSVTGLKVSQWTGSGLAVSDENIKLPAGYTFVDSSNNAVTTLASGTVYTIAAVTTYTVTVTTPENGSVTADKPTATEGETVTLTVTPAEGYELDVLTVTYGDDNTAVTVNSDNTFTMPAGNVTVSATFKKISYTITVNTAENGTVSADKETAAEGATITLTVAPNDGYQIGTVTVKDAEGNTVAFTETGVASGTYTFTMPASNVTVEATFTAIEKTSADISWGSLAYTYTDEAGVWSAGTAAGAGTVTVTNTGTTAITATPAYEATTTEYGNITGSFDAASADLAAEASKTFTLSLNGTPTKAIPAGTKIGSVTITIEKAQQGSTAKQDVTISLVDGAKLNYYYSDGEVDLATLVANNAGLDMSYVRTGGTGDGTITGSVLDFYINGTHIIEVTTAETDTYNAGSFTFTLTVTLDPGLESDGPVDTNPGIDLPIDRN